METGKRHSSEPHAQAALIEEAVQRLGSREAAERQSARKTLVAAGDAAVDALLPLLNDRRELKRWEAAKALIDIASPHAAAALVAALDDEEFDVRWLAAEALGKLQGAALPPLLSALEKRSDSSYVREGAHHVLKQLQEGKLRPVVAPVLAALEHSAAEVTVPIAARMRVPVFLDHKPRKQDRSGYGGRRPVSSETFRHSTPHLDSTHVREESY